MLDTAASVTGGGHAYAALAIMVRRSQGVDFPARTCLPPQGPQACPDRRGAGVDERARLEIA